MEYIEGLVASYCLVEKLRWTILVLCVFHIIILTCVCMPWMIFMLYLYTSLYSLYTDYTFAQLSHMVVCELLQRAGPNKDGQPDSTVE
jgi:hypothetical protein